MTRSAEQGPELPAWREWLRGHLCGQKQTQPLLLVGGHQPLQRNSASQSKDF